MSDYISREAASADSDRNKIKTPFARIVVEGTPGKPYYNIWYFCPADGECHIGFGSYCLDNVFNWLAEEFEITEPHTDVAPVVRCEDCLFWESGENECESWEWCKALHREMPPHAFCSLGERKGDSDDEAD